MTKGEMNRGVVFLVLLFAAMLLYPAQALGADELTEIKQQMSQLMERIAQIENNQKLRERELSQQIQQLSEKKVEPVVIPDWVKNVKISGDFRYRHEQIDAEHSSSVRWYGGQARDRIRVRLMLEAIVNDQWDVAFRLASGNAHVDDAYEGDPISTNQELTHAFSRKYIWLDLAYFNWHPVWAKGLNVYGGKIPNPFYKAGGSSNEMIWDGDLTPEGIGTTYLRPMGDKDELRFAAGGFWVNEVHDTTTATYADLSLWGAQAYWKHMFEKPTYLLFGASYYDYGNIQGASALATTWRTSATTRFFGNTYTSGNKYRYDYDLLELFAEYGFKFVGLPMAVYGDWVKNTVAPSGAATGWLLGTTLNKAIDPGSWELNYTYREIDTDAVVGQFNSSDFMGGGTDGRGHQVGLTYQVAKNLQTALTYALCERDAGANGRSLDYRRFQADVLLKFK